MKRFGLFLTAFLFTVALFGQDFALEQLEKSPRHHEWVGVEYEGRTVHSFVTYPQRSDDAPAVIVIHENRGLTDWVRSFSDRLAGEGYLVIAPDLLSEFDAEHAKTSSFGSSDAARNAIYQLEADQITSDLHAVYEYMKSEPASTGEVYVMGFCWGGSQTFRYATNNPNIQGSLVFYGTAPEDPQAIGKIGAPVYGFYGGNDQRVNSTIEKTETLMKEAGKTYRYQIYPGAGHAYMRRGADPEGSQENKQARENSWQRMLQILESR